jgi:glycosyltransferase involved in cell wall biosynthesis
MIPINESLPDGSGHRMYQDKLGLVRGALLRTNLGRRYTLPGKFILNPARFLTLKNHKRLVTGAAAVRSLIPDISLVFTGVKDEDYDAARSRAIQFGMADGITFGGRVAPCDIVGFYQDLVR